MQIGIERRQEPAAQHPLGDAHADKLVAASTVTLDTAKPMDASWQTRTDEPAHDAEPDHGEPHDRQREPDTLWAERAIRADEQPPDHRGREDDGRDAPHVDVPF